MDRQEAKALHRYSAQKELPCSFQGLILYPMYHSASPGWGDGNHLRSLSLQQTPTASAKDQVCRGIWRSLEQALQRVKIILGTPQQRMLLPYSLELFQGLLNSRNWNNQIIKAVAQIPTNKEWTAFSLVAGKTVLLWLQARIQKRLTKPC